MKRALLLFLLLSLFCFGYSQSSCFSIDIGSDTTLPCGSNCVSLSVSGAIPRATDSYSVSQIAYQPFPYDTGTEVLINIDDWWSSTIPISFPFCFFDKTYTHLLVSSNGAISFDTSYANQYATYVINDSVPSSGIPEGYRNSVMGPFQDIDPHYQGHYYHNVIGTAPCRKFVFSCFDIPYFGDPNSGTNGFCSSAMFATNQIVLHEGTNIIDINIANKDTCPNWNGGVAIEGIIGQNGTKGYAVPGRNYPSSWTAQNDAWRFAPAGNYSGTISWYQNDVIMSGSGPFTLCSLPPQTKFSVQGTFLTCTGDQIVLEDSFKVTLSGTLTIGPDSLKHVSCYGGSNGGVKMKLEGGIPPVAYGWNTGDTSLQLQNLMSGIYIFTATDGSACVLSKTVVIEEPDSMRVYMSKTNTLPGLSTGSISVDSIHGGTPPYNISINYCFQCPNPFEDLPSGTYTIVIADSIGCIKSTTITLSEISGIEDLDDEAISIYPNPSSMNNIKLSITNELVGSLMEVYDVNGMQVFQTTINQQQTTISPALSAGVYFIRIHSERASVVKRWVRL
ncbi:MAG: T9SS type A sorting domain-containing protein [Bacteroidetes bacterium]|nr:T9SS type A sorting domain-containing protein [Bacteroidota bacterium]